MEPGANHSQREHRAFTTTAGRDQSTSQLPSRYCRDRPSVGGENAVQNHRVWLLMRIENKKTFAGCHICNMTSRGEILGVHFQCAHRKYFFGFIQKGYLWMCLQKNICVIFMLVLIWFSHRLCQCLISGHPFLGMPAGVLTYCCAHSSRIS